MLYLVVGVKKGIFEKILVSVFWSVSFLLFFSKCVYERPSFMQEKKDIRNH